MSNKINPNRSARSHSQKKSKTNSPKRPTKDFASKVLRTVPAESAFYFYSDVGNPTGIIATSLQDFHDCIRSLDVGSIQFHLGMGDFENWVRFLGDDDLSQSIRELSSESPTGEAMRQALLTRVRERLDLLQASA